MHIYWIMPLSSVFLIFLGMLDLRIYLKSKSAVNLHQVHKVRRLISAVVFLVAGLIISISFLKLL
jgi:hypothetical protein